MTQEHDDALHWAAYYERGPSAQRYQNVFLFGSNPEVEDALLANGCHNLRVFDDRVEKSLVPCEPWTTGVADILNNPEYHYFLICGVASTPKQRAVAIQRIEELLAVVSNWAWTNVRASTAYISASATLGQGVLVLDTCYLGPLVALKDHSVMLPGAKIYHHGVLESYSILVGGSTALGHSKIREGSRVCGNAVVFPHAEVGPAQTVPALTAAVVERDDARKFFEEFGREPE
jgi:hypothetical protein